MLKKIIIFIIFIIAVVMLFASLSTFLMFVGLLIILESGSYYLVFFTRKNFQWFITPKDFFPTIDHNGLKKFIESGYDSELGWIRKPFSRKEELGRDGKTFYTINNFGARSNPNHENLNRLISCYGDSFTFCRQVNDNETFEWYLSEITKTNVLNFGVGNYGLDQSIMRLWREYPLNKTKIVIIGVVPSTIVRNLCVWKHYNEFGNVFGFKPRFLFNDGQLELIRNIIDSEDKFKNYIEYIPKINSYDEFYETKFKKEMICFPYFISIISNPKRNLSIISMILWNRFINKNKQDQTYPNAMQIIMDINLKLRVDLFTKNIDAVNLLQKIVSEFIEYGEKNDFTPVFLWMPQKDDILHIKKKNIVFYEKFISHIKQMLTVVDLTDFLVQYKELDDLYSDDSRYGGHFNKKGNAVIADYLYKSLCDKGILEKNNK